MTYGEVIARLEREGWSLSRQNGSHRVYRHEKKTGIVVVAPHSMGSKVPPGTLSSIAKQAGWKGR